MQTAQKIDNRNRNTNAQKVAKVQTARVERAQSFEKAQKATVWSRVKSAAKKVGGFFKKVGRTMAKPFQGTNTEYAPVARVAMKTYGFVRYRAPRAIVRGTKTTARVAWSIVKDTGRFIARHWVELTVAGLWVTALVLAPAATLIATVFIAGGIAIAFFGGSVLAVVIGRIVIELGMHILFEGIANRRR